MEISDEKKLQKDQENAARKAAIEILNQAGHRVLPDYCNLPISTNILSKSIKNAAIARSLFAAEAQTDVENEHRIEARFMLNLARIGYDGFRADQNIAEFPQLLPLASDEMPDDLQSLYSAENGLFTLGGLKAWIGKLKSSERAPDTLIVSFSGTSFNLDQIRANLSQVVACSEVYLHAVGLVQLVTEQFPLRPLALVGHSLGGGLAQFALASVISEKNKDYVCAYCFNSAGLNYMAYESLHSKGTLPLAKYKVFHYIIKDEPVSAAFGQIGQTVVLRSDNAKTPLEKHRMSAFDSVL